MCLPAKKIITMILIFILFWIQSMCFQSFATCGSDRVCNEVCVEWNLNVYVRPCWYVAINTFTHHTAVYVTLYHQQPAVWHANLHCGSTIHAGRCSYVCIYWKVQCCLFKCANWKISSEFHDIVHTIFDVSNSVSSHFVALQKPDCAIWMLYERNNGPQTCIVRTSHQWQWPQ